MLSLNKVMLGGNLTRDPEGRHTTSGHSVCKLGLAVNRRFRDANGQDREEVCFVDIETWGRTADSCRNNLRKGSSVMVEGRLKMEQWTDRESGKNRSRMVVVAERVHFLSPRQSNEVRDQGEPYQYNQPAPQYQVPQTQTQQVPQTQSQRIPQTQSQPAPSYNPPPAQQRRLSLENLRD